MAVIDLRRRDLVLASSALLAAPFARAQQPGRIYRIGALFAGGAAAMQLYRSALKERLALHGFVEGRNLQIDARGATAIFHEDREAVREMVTAKADAIFTCLDRVTEAAQAATQSVPIVFAWVADPVTTGFVKSYSRPGGNVTGVTNRFGELALKRLELVRELLPKATRAAVIGRHLPDSLYEVVAPHLRRAAAQLSFDLIEFSTVQWVPGLDRAVKAGAEAVLLFGSFVGQMVSADQVIEYANQHRIPAVFAETETVERGGLISYGTNLVDDIRRAGDLLARVLRGARPADLPIDQAARFELAVNLKAAQTIGLKVPTSIVVRADRVIE